MFNLTIADAPVLEARLTETDGLPQADAAAVGQQAGDQFGSAVAIAGNDTAGYYAVVGARITASRVLSARGRPTSSTRCPIRVPATGPAGPAPPVPAARAS